MSNITVIEKKKHITSGDIERFYEMYDHLCFSLRESQRLARAADEDIDLGVCSDPFSIRIRLLISDIEGSIFNPTILDHFIRRKKLILEGKLEDLT